MKLKAMVLSLGVALFFGVYAPAVLAGNPDACSLLSADQVGAALGIVVEVNQGGNQRTCLWQEAGKSSFAGKMVEIDIMGQVGSLSPIERFNNAKQPVPGMTKPPLEGVGDDAYYIENPRFTSLNVRKGNLAFEVHIGGVAPEQRRPLLKSLAQLAVSKL